MPEVQSEKAHDIRRRKEGRGEKRRRDRTFVNSTVGYNVNRVAELERPDVCGGSWHPVLSEGARKFFARALAKTLVLSHCVGSVLDKMCELLVIDEAASFACSGHKKMGEEAKAHLTTHLGWNTELLGCEVALEGVSGM